MSLASLSPQAHLPKPLETQDPEESMYVKYADPIAEEEKQRLLQSIDSGLNTTVQSKGASDSFAGQPAAMQANPRELRSSMRRVT